MPLSRYVPIVFAVSAPHAITGLKVEAESAASSGYIPPALREQVVYMEHHKVKDNETYAESDCDCLNWKEQYRSGAIKCGQGFENVQAYYMQLDYNYTQLQSDITWSWEEYLDRVNGFEYKYLNSFRRAVGSDWCKAFERLDDTACIKVMPGAAEGTWMHNYWCFVGDKCKAPTHTEGMPLSRMYSADSAGLIMQNVKFCKSGRDKIIELKTVADFPTYLSEHPHLKNPVTRDSIDFFSEMMVKTRDF